MNNMTMLKIMIIFISGIYAPILEEQTTPNQAFNEQTQDKVKKMISWLKTAKQVQEQSAEDAVLNHEALEKARIRHEKKKSQA